VAPLRPPAGAGYRALWGGFLDEVSSYGGGRVLGTHQGTAHDEVGQNGYGALRRWPALGCWSSGGVTRGTSMKGVDLGFRLLQEEIRGDVAVIYRASCSMISQAVGTLSPSRIRFKMTLVPLKFIG
jgi:hypothetical protein